jgi:hypothetical protein
VKKVVVNSGRDDAQFKIDQVESEYNAKFVGQFCLKTVDGGWANSPTDVYYVQNPDTSLGHSHYFGLFSRNGTTYITRGDSGVEPDISAVIAHDGEIIYSRYRHDYRVSNDQSVFIDGGRDYTRGPSGTYATLKVIDGEFYQYESEDWLDKDESEDTDAA